jgi:hypothetical protein
MSRRISVVVGAAVALSAMAVTIASAVADSRAPTKQKLTIVGHSEFKVNKLAFDNQRFSKTTFAIKSGR